MIIKVRCSMVGCESIVLVQADSVKILEGSVLCPECEPTVEDFPMFPELPTRRQALKRGRDSYIRGEHYDG